MDLFELWFSGYMPRHGIAGSYGSFIPRGFFCLLRNHHTVIQIDGFLTLGQREVLSFLFKGPTFSHTDL